MATNAYHQLGNTSSNKPDLCYVYNEDKNNWCGAWETGFGFLDVRFPKETTRDLTKKEIDYYSRQYLFIDKSPIGLIKIKGYK